MEGEVEGFGGEVCAKNSFGGIPLSFGNPSSLHSSFNSRQPLPFQKPQRMSPLFGSA